MTDIDIKMPQEATEVHIPYITPYKQFGHAGDSGKYMLVVTEQSGGRQRTSKLPVMMKLPPYSTAVAVERAILIAVVTRNSATCMQPTVYGC